MTEKYTSFWLVLCFGSQVVTWFVVMLAALVYPFYWREVMGKSG